MNREQLIAAMCTAPALKRVHIEGWGDLHIRPMSVEQVDLQQQEAATEGKDPMRFARLAARVLCDEKGVLLFNSESTDDLKLLASQDWAKLRKILEAEADDAGLSVEGAAAAKNG